jgi:hypothetical protein
MRPIDDVRDISRIAYGFIASKAFFAALEFNVFGELKGTAKPLEALAKATGVSPPRLKTLLANLVSLGLVTRAGDLYANSPAAERYLVPGSPAYFGDYYRLQVNRQLYPAAAPLEDALKGDEANSRSPAKSRSWAIRSRRRSSHAPSTQARSDPPSCSAVAWTC